MQLGRLVVLRGIPVIPLGIMNYNRNYQLGELNGSINEKDQATKR
jgi:hypothetical protein